MQRIKRNDTVAVIAGKERGRQGEVRQVLPHGNRVIVQGVNIVKRHQRPRSLQQRGGIIEREASIPVSNVMVVCKVCNRPVRVGYRRRDDGAKVRFCKKCDQDID
ncbi:MAG: 50S ribosomal protein L24 [Dehalococcoidia bacterium]